MRIVRFAAGHKARYGVLEGDVIATGTPSGIDRMNPGDVVEVSIEKIGTLRNFVAGSK